jgi:hypothetical protein|uniref:hypothetical protein n=1 Tax=Yoonia sp. TaxID=2212373 RepID=UPI004047F0DC
MNGYELSRIWFNWCFENPEKIKPNHTALYFFCVEHCNRLGWKSKFGLPTTMAKEAIGIRSYNTYSQTLQDLVDWGFITMVERSKNQHSSNIVALSNFNKALDNALDKATIKHATKQSESTGESIGSIVKPLTIEQNNQEQETSGAFFEDEDLEVPRESEFDIFWKIYQKGTNKFAAMQEFYLIDEAEYPKILKHVPLYVKATPTHRKDAANYLKLRVWLDTELPTHAVESKQDIPVHQRSYAERVKFAEENGIKLGSAQYNRLVNKTGL